MTDLDVVQRVAGLFGIKYVNVRNDLRNPKWKRAYGIKLNGPRAVALMRQLRSHMGERRRVQIDKAIEGYPL